MSTTIELLQNQLDKISSLRDLSSSEDPEFKKWHQLTSAIIERKLGKEKSDDFPSTSRFWPNRFGPWEDYELKESLDIGLDSAGAYLQGLIEELEIFGEENKSNPISNNSQDVNSNFRDMRVSGGTVILGNGNTVTNIEVRELINAIEKEIEEKVPASEEKNRVLESLKAITQNQSFAAVAGTVIGEIIKRTILPPS